MTDTSISHHRKTRRLKLAAWVIAVGGLAAAIAAPPLASASKPRAPKPTVVLVHGAFADASGWNDVTNRLQRDGYDVIAPANPLRTVESDSAYIRSVLDTIAGPIVLVGHSYGGFVITNAAAGDPDVEALVYVAGFAPTEGETVGQLSAMNPGSGLADPANLIVRPTPTGADGYINPATFRDIFAADLPRDVTVAMAASQRPADLATLGQPSGEPAWQTIPSWYVVASEDHTIPPATQRFMAQRAGATTVEVRSSHVAMISHPKQVANVIEDAASATS
jgi:pimeloyl-ACP methyl ester carboxylesterase